jgi:hypothetical protein
MADYASDYDDHSNPHTPHRPTPPTHTNPTHHRNTPRTTNATASERRACTCTYSNSWLRTPARLVWGNGLPQASVPGLTMSCLSFLLLACRTADNSHTKPPRTAVGSPLEPTSGTTMSSGGGGSVQSAAAAAAAAATDEDDSNVQMWKVKQLIRKLSAARGNGTSMISLIIPPRDQVSRVQKMLGDEFGTASNIKSRVTRQSVLSAITSTQQKLKNYTKVPPNGLVLYCGMITTGAW